MAGKLTWDGDRARARIEAELTRRLQRAAKVVWGRAKQLINVDGTGVRATSAGKGKARKRKGSLIYGADPSKPGDPPHKQRGHLLRSVAWEVSGLVARIGTNLDYGRFLELGTVKMAARPWLRRALNETRDEVKRILSAPMDLK